MLCYYKETFTLGFLSAFFVFAMMTLFEDALKKWVGRLFSLSEGRNANS